MAIVQTMTVPTLYFHVVSWVVAAAIYDNLEHVRHAAVVAAVVARYLSYSELEVAEEADVSL